MIIALGTQFQPGEGPSRGLLRDCTTSPINWYTVLVNVGLVLVNVVCDTLVCYQF